MEEFQLEGTFGGLWSNPLFRVRSGCSGPAFVVLGLFCFTLSCVFRRAPGLHSAGAQCELTHLQGAQAFKRTDVSSPGSLFEGEWGFPAV